MHLKLDTSGSIDDGDVARDLGQEPADIVVLSAADSDLAAFGAAYATLAGNFPSVRLTNLLALGHPASVAALSWLTALSWRHRRAGNLSWKGRVLP